jgi:hypothetical protein
MGTFTIPAAIKLQYPRKVPAPGILFHPTLGALKKFSSQLVSPVMNLSKLHSAATPVQAKRRSANLYKILLGQNGCNA